MEPSEDPALLLLSAIQIGGHLVRIAEGFGEHAAARQIAAGLELLQARADLALELHQGLFDHGDRPG